VFKASIGLVVLAFITLTYGWIRGIDILLYGSIAFSALAGVALLRSTLIERRKHPEQSRRNRRRRDFEDTGEQKVVLRERDRKSLAELRMELSGLKGDIHAADREELYGTTKRAPLRPFNDSPADEEDGFEEVGRVPHDHGPAPARRTRRPEQPPARSPAQTDDFRSRLSAVLGEGEALESPQPEGRPSRPRTQSPRPEPQQPRAEPFFEDDDEIGTDWIRIEDVPRISRATRESGGYAQPEPPPLQPPKRRTPPGASRKGAPARPESTSPARRRTAGAKDAPAKPAGSRGGASRGAKGPAEPETKPGEPRVPRTRPKPEA
jgi:hypothetical protein